MTISADYSFFWDALYKVSRLNGEKFGNKQSRYEISSRGVFRNQAEGGGGNNFRIYLHGLRAEGKKK